MNDVDAFKVARGIFHQIIVCLEYTDKCDEDIEDIEMWARAGLEYMDFALEASPNPSE
jgi:hypothetical protein